MQCPLCKEQIVPGQLVVPIGEAIPPELGGVTFNEIQGDRAVIFPRNLGIHVDCLALCYPKVTEEIGEAHG